MESDTAGVAGGETEASVLVAAGPIPKMFVPDTETVWGSDGRAPVNVHDPVADLPTLEQPKSNAPRPLLAVTA